MAHAIPKIHYGIIETTGDTVITDGTISAVPDTTDIVVGMFVSGTGVPAGATVQSKTSSTVEILPVASANGSTVALKFFYKIEFEYPPIETTGERLLPQERRSVSLSGVTQVSVDHIEGVRNLNFRFLTNTLYLALKVFYDGFGAYGESFEYFDDKTTASYTTCELKNLDWVPEKITARATTYVWGVPLQIRRVV